MTDARKEPGAAHATVIFVGVLTIMIAGLALSDFELHILLIAALVWVCGNAALLGNSFKTIRDCMNNGVFKALGALYMFILIGIVIAALIESGTIPTVIYYAIGFVSPGWFLPASLLFTSFMSVTTGTSWGTVGTVGVILVGLGIVIGIPAPVVAGAVISGALFGDKMSPVSDTTILASACAETDVYSHIRSMSYTTGPAYVIALLLFAIISWQYDATAIDSAEIELIKVTLAETFNIHLAALLPLLVLVVLSYRGTPAEATMLSASIVAVLIAATLQDREFGEIFKSVQYGFSASTGVQDVDSLLNRGGIQSMMWTMSLAFIALALGGVLDGIGVIRSMMRKLIEKIRNAAQLVAATIGSALIANMSMGENYLTIIFSSQLFKTAFEKLKLRRSMLSRTVEEGGTLTAGLIPWTTTGAFFAASLNVSTLDYAPWVLLSLVNLVTTILMATFGIAVFYRSDSEDSR